jgi:hypothetical protein
MDSNILHLGNPIFIDASTKHAGFCNIISSMVIANFAVESELLELNISSSKRENVDGAAHRLI